MCEMGNYQRTYAVTRRDHRQPKQVEVKQADPAAEPEWLRVLGEPAAPVAQPVMVWRDVVWMEVE